MMGLPKATAFDKAVAEGKDIERQQVERDMLGGEDVSRSAQQVFQLIKGAYPSEALTLPGKCDEYAPNDINVYTDGSLIHPNNSQFSLGGSRSVVANATKPTGYTRSTGGRRQGPFGGVRV